MNYGELTTRFKAILNRRDCTDALAQSFIGQGIQKVQRVLQIPPFERTLTVTASVTAQSTITIPDDFIALKYIRGDKRTLDRLDIDDFLRRAQDAEVSTQPLFFTREDNTWKIWPSLAVDSELVIVYYGEDDALSASTDESTLTVIAPDLVIYAALLYAADYFGDDRIAAWQQLYAAALDEVMAQAATEEFSGSPMVVQPMYDGADY